MATKDRMGMMADILSHSFGDDALVGPGQQQQAQPQAAPANPPKQQPAPKTNPTKPAPVNPASQQAEQQRVEPQQPKQQAAPRQEQVQSPQSVQQLPEEQVPDEGRTTPHVPSPEEQPVKQEDEDEQPPQRESLEAVRKRMKDVALREMVKDILEQAEGDRSPDESVVDRAMSILMDEDSELSPDEMRSVMKMIESLGAEASTSEFQQPSEAEIQSDPKERHRLEKMQTFQKAKPVHTEPLGKIEGAPQLLTFEDGTRGVWKRAKDQRRMNRVGIPDGDRWKREMAAYEVARILGFDDLVPVTTHRGEGSIQDYKSDGQTATRVSNSGMSPFDGYTNAARAALFDYIIGSSDRHTGNWLVTGMGDILLIDNELSFPNKYDKADFDEYEFLTNAKKRNLDMPDVSNFTEETWGKCERALRRCGLDDEAIRLTKERFLAVVRNAGKKIVDLPFFYGEKGQTLRTGLK